MCWCNLSSLILLLPACSGGWWLTQHGKTEKEVQQLQTGELSTGRVAM